MKDIDQIKEELVKNSKSLIYYFKIHSDQERSNIIEFLMRNGFDWNGIMPRQNEFNKISHVFIKYFFNKFVITYTSISDNNTFIEKSLFNYQLLNFDKIKNPVKKFVNTLFEDII